MQVLVDLTNGLYLGSVFAWGWLVWGWLLFHSAASGRPWVGPLRLCLGLWQPAMGPQAESANARLEIASSRLIQTAHQSWSLAFAQSLFLIPYWFHPSWPLSQYNLANLSISDPNNSVCFSSDMIGIFDIVYWIVFLICASFEEIEKSCLMATDCRWIHRRHFSLLMLALDTL